MGLEETADKVLVDFATPWAVAHQALLSMGFSKQGYWSGLSFPFPEDLPHPGTEPGSPALQVDSLLNEPPGNCPKCFMIGGFPVCFQTSCNSEPSSLQPNDPVTNICQAADKQLFTLVEWAKRIPHFSSLPLDDQVILLRAGQ